MSPQASKIEAKHLVRQVSQAVNELSKRAAECPELVRSLKAHDGDLLCNGLRLQNLGNHVGDFV